VLNTLATHHVGQRRPNGRPRFTCFPESAEAGGVVLAGFDNCDQKTGIVRIIVWSVPLTAAVKQFGKTASGILGKRLICATSRDAGQILDRLVSRNAFFLALDETVHRFPQNMRQRRLFPARDSLHPVASVLIEPQANAGRHESTIT
jgi:hypothetical protein